ncbi:serine/threonine protein kinase [Pontiella sulfatireligans]|uniref:Serine/threonine-protein kinase PknD n=1 Tax=Pontiella sulfatireligans TaxID=2750658 RepID=A0A6C2UEX6_9BACT|nr:serine/threonine-protein kinase [Pontiella sulfatireligans]VGO18668.1 Serine/threonine-protein kinase PknD [Pontiella sulfatireligans]
MENSPNNDKERYQRRKSVLRKFYAADPGKPTPEELEWSTPILNSLKETENRYEELEPIAAGGEKRIVRTLDKRLKRCVAMAHPIKTETPDDFEQFLREAQLTANLMHPNIVPIYNMGIGDDGHPFFSMELVPGDSLKDIIQKLKDGDASYKTQYPLETLLGIFNKVCDAVAYAHSCNVLHLDIKPDNIRVGQFGEVFLCDWGLAHVGIDETATKKCEPNGLDGEVLNDMTLSGTMKGTPGFMAPEQVTGEAKTPRTDIYALGAILYSILTHELPVEGRQTNEVLENTRNGNVIHPRTRRPGRPAPTSLTAVAMKALATSPKRRYVSTQELQQDINRYLTGYPTEAEHAGIYTRMILLTHRHRKLSFWLIAFMALLFVVVSINLSIIRREKKTAEENFALYREEKETLVRVSEELATLSYHTQEVRSYISANSMIPVTQRILARDDIDPETKQATLREKARMHFMLQQFNAAEEALEQVHDTGLRGNAMLNLCREYAVIKPDDSGFLSGHDLAQLLTNTDAINRDMSLFLYFHYTRRVPSVVPEEHAEVVAVMLSRLNELSDEEIPQLRLSKQAEGYHLDLSHTPYSAYLVTIPLVYRQNLLQHLNLYSLDISHTPVSLTRELKNLKTKELRMIGVSLEPASNLAWTLQGIGLDRLIVGKGEYPESVLKKIRFKGIEVMEEAGNVEY